VVALYILGCQKPLASQVRIRCGWTMGETGTALAGNTGGGGAGWATGGEEGVAEEAVGGRQWLVERV
jgi:hypothetical protein